MFDDALRINGRLTLELFDEQGRLKHVVDVKNIVTNTGKAGIANRMQPAPTVPSMSHMAVGTGGTAPAVTDVALGAEIGRVALASQTVAGAVVTYLASFPAGVGTGALVEAGLFNAGSSGDMQNRTTFAVINKAAGDVLNVTWTVTVG